MADAQRDPAPESLRAHLDSLGKMFLTKADLPLRDETLRALRTPDPNDTHLSPEVAAGAAARATECEIESITSAAIAGTFHQVYVARLKGHPDSVVVRLGRLWREGTDWGMRADELATMYADERIACAWTVEVDISRKWAPVDTQVCTLAPGLCLRDFDNDEAAITTHIADLARALRELHEQEGHGFGFLDLGPDRKPGGPNGIHATWSRHVLNRLNEHVEACHTAQLITSDECARIRRIFTGSQSSLDSSPSRLLHGDCGNHNVFTGDGHGPVLIDWEDALVGDPFYDLAMWATFHPERRWPAFFEAYGQDWNIPRFWLLFLRIALAKTVHRLRFGYTDAPGRAPASLRIQRALAAMRELDRG